MHGLRHNIGYRLAEGSDTLAEVLAAAGYANAAYVAAMVLNRDTGMDQGFHTYDDVGHALLGAALSADLDKTIVFPRSPNHLLTWGRGQQGLNRVPRDRVGEGVPLRRTMSCGGLADSPNSALG